ncbi:YceI family protein [Zunongwangia endophytica]|uniref:YceI family protein n=1 Tax=Zunongwangia endophytica TaxID=1808945 RepID=A0ABV8HE04_9FLAO|nr:YceI family protein [Zunongwangia endophytica]MDN3596230.1 YceI family protein [Zunongwangia endophytica]
MKTYIYILLFAFFGIQISFAQSTEQKNLKISKNSRLYITGDTNINSFNCKFNSDELPDHLKVIYNKQQNALTFKNTTLKLNSKAFDCGSRPINKDFEALMKAEKFPYILLNLKKLQFKNLKSAEITIEINIAGVTKQFEVPVQIDQTTSNYKGTILLNINDFKLEPPKKVFGLIKVKEEIQIEFDLYFEN